MDIKQLSPNHAVSPQISVEDIPAIVAAGFKTVICNRPDVEIPPSHHAAVIEAAVKDAGLDFVTIPVTHHGLNLELVQAQKTAIAGASGPSLAYCASGTRSSIVWSLTQAGEVPTDEIIAATAAAGYDLAGMRGQIDALSGN